MRVNLSQNTYFQGAEKSFHETALYSTEMVKCSIQTTTAALERNEEIVNKQGDDRRRENISEQVLNCKPRSNSNNNINNDVEDAHFEKSKQEFDRLNQNLFQSLSIHRSVY